MSVVLARCWLQFANQNEKFDTWKEVWLPPWWDIRDLNIKSFSLKKTCFDELKVCWVKAKSSLLLPFNSLRSTNKHLVCNSRLVVHRSLWAKTSKYIGKSPKFLDLWVHAIPFSLNRNPKDLRSPIKLGFPIWKCKPSYMISLGQRKGTIDIMHWETGQQKLSHWQLRFVGVT